MKLNLDRFAVVMGLLAVSFETSAHHGVGAQFDLSQTTELQGEVTQLIWRNPHVRFTVGVTNDAGEVDQWVVEAQSVSMLRSRDITDVLLEIGDTITLVGNPARGGITEIYVTNLLLPDGREVIFSSGAEPKWKDQVLGRTGPRFTATGDSSNPELGLFRTWSSAPAFRARRFDFDTHPLTDAARAAGNAYDGLTDNFTTGECTSRGMPNIVGNPYPRNFIDQGDTIIMRLEEYDTVRTIHLSPDAAGAEPPASSLGYSIGRWENGTLVVTTTNVSDVIFTLNIPLSDELHIVERITPSADGSRLEHLMTVTDPAAFLEPVELAFNLIYVPGVVVEPYECTEGEVQN